MAIFHCYFPYLRFTNPSCYSTTPGLRLKNPDIPMVPLGPMVRLETTPLRCCTDAKSLSPWSPDKSPPMTYQWMVKTCKNRPKMVRFEVLGWLFKVYDKHYWHPDTIKYSCDMYLSAINRYKAIGLPHYPMIFSGENPSKKNENKNTMNYQYIVIIWWIIICYYNLMN